MITLLDYGAGNVRSVVNAIESLGEQVRIVETGEDILSAEKLVFPGVGAFGNMMEILNRKNFVAPLMAYLKADRPFLGICLGLQALFSDSEEAPNVPGLGFIPGTVKRFSVDLSVPHIGWNGLNIHKPSSLFLNLLGDEKFYFVHSYHVCPEKDECGADHHGLWFKVCERHSKGKHRRHSVSSGKKRQIGTVAFQEFH